MAPSVLDAWAVERFPDFLGSLFAAVPAGFLLAFLLGLLGYGIGKLFGLLSSLLTR